MWYPPEIITPAASEPVSVADAKDRLRIDASDSDADIARLIAAARAHVESVTGTFLMAQTVRVLATEWGDLERLPVAPIQSVSSITYTDTDGVEQILGAEIYEVRAAGDTLSPAILLKDGQSWPARQRQSLIKVEAVVGYADLPESLQHVIFLLVGWWYQVREAAVTGVSVHDLPFGVDALLASHRRWA